MNHLTELQCSMYVDGALSTDDASECVNHTRECPSCHAKIETFKADQRIISTALLDDPAGRLPQLALPKFKKTVGLREFAFANLLTGLLFWFAQFSSKAIFGEIVVDGFSWLTSIFIPDFYNLTVTTILYFTNEGTVMIENYSEFIAAAILTVLVSWLLLTVIKSRQAFSLCILTGLLGGGLAIPQDAAAIEHLRDNVIIASTETIDDTVLFTGESIVVDGHVTGDLIAFGSRVVVTGKVDGNLIAFAESLSIGGQVSGTTVNAGNTVALTDAVLKGDFWGAAESIQMSRETTISGNAMVAAQLASIQGKVGKDLTTLTKTIELRGHVGEDMVAYARDVKLLGDADIVGNLTIHSESENSLSRSPEAVVGGSVKFEHHDIQGRSRNRYATAQFYGFQVLRLAAAFIIGYGLFMLFPAVRTVTLNGGTSGLMTAGVGVLALVSLPVILLLLAMTVVGLPLTLLGFSLWFLGLYLAKIMVAWLIGGVLFDDPEGEKGPALPLLAGLATVLIAVNLPFIGGVISLIMTVVGIGMITQWILNNYSKDAFDAR
ncbi:MAG: cytoskeletal protein CcmA (bactofilin family) [Flavobacterium sp.]|jgi:cytoskeletal protein CcmA (bactofilin family)